MKRETSPQDTILKNIRRTFFQHGLVPRGTTIHHSKKSFLIILNYIKLNLYTTTY